MNEEYTSISLSVEKADHEEMKKIAANEKDVGEVKPNFTKFYRIAVKMFLESRKKKSGTTLVEYTLIISVSCGAVYGFFQMLGYFAKLILY